MIFSASEASPWECFDIQQSRGKLICPYFENVYLRVTVSLQAWGLEMKSGSCVKVKADLYWDLSIVYLYICSANCQAGRQTEAWAESLPHKGHSLSAPGSGLPFNRRQTASCMCGQNNSTSSVGLNRQLFVEQLSACLSETQPTHVWQWSNIFGVCGTSYSKQWRAAPWNQSVISFKGWILW